MPEAQWGFATSPIIYNEPRALDFTVPIRSEVLIQQRSAAIGVQDGAGEHKRRLIAIDQIRPGIPCLVEEHLHNRASWRLGFLCQFGSVIA